MCHLLGLDKQLALVFYPCSTITAVSVLIRYPIFSSKLSLSPIIITSFGCIDSFLSLSTFLRLWYLDAIPSQFSKKNFSYLSFFSFKTPPQVGISFLFYLRFCSSCKTLFELSPKNFWSPFFLR